jgi:hypothetical protein
MSKERDALKKAIGIINFTHPNTWHEFISEVQELLAQPEQEPEAWILKEKETGYKTQVAYRPSVLKKGWEAIPLYPQTPLE